MVPTTSFRTSFLLTPGPLRAQELTTNYEITYLQTHKWHMKQKKLKPGAEWSARKQHRESAPLYSIYLR